MMQRPHPLTFLELVGKCDNFPYADVTHKRYYKLLLPHDDRPFGFMLPEVVEKMPWTKHFGVDYSERTVEVIDSSKGNDTAAACNAAFDELIEICIELGTFKTLYRGSGEFFEVPGARYLAHGDNAKGSTGIVRINRFAASLFGIVSRGAHLTAYVRTEEGIKIWVPRRSSKLEICPSLLDSTVAGGVPAGEEPFNTIVREAEEEASLANEHVLHHARSAGALSYMVILGEASGRESGVVVPEIEYVFDLELPGHVVPHPRDDEVKEFYLMTVDEVKMAMVNQEFKVNSAAVMIDFFIRHGIITAANEDDFVEIQARIHRRLPFGTNTSPTPRRKP